MGFDKGLLRSVNERLKDNEANIDILYKAHHLLHRYSDAVNSINIEISHLRKTNTLLQEIKQLQNGNNKE